MDLRLRLAAFALVALAAAPRVAFAQLSPGDLARAHASLEGLSNCTKCHKAGQQLGPEPCLACHTELKTRVDKGRGYHGRLVAAERAACERCHHEHQGRDAELVEWPSGKRERFDHAATGWPLKGKHAGPACKACHTNERIADAEVLAHVKRAPFETYLGLAARCAACHFDEHRGQLAQTCEKCHGEASWKPLATPFDHGKTEYPLVGAHKGVGCVKCHALVPDEARATGTLTPRASTFTRYKPLVHARCADCHADPHEGKFPGACESCHTVESWHTIRDAEMERSFHQRTNFPLRGAHLDVACKACHGPSAGAPAKFKGLPHERCMDCHADAHAGQLAKPACDRCHTEKSFAPPRFELEQHAATRYPLEGAHAAVACSACHTADPKLVKKVDNKGRKRALSPTRFTLPAERCESCHKDPHAGQLAPPEGCKRCHATSSFHVVKFDHAKDSRFALEGKHARAACASCHTKDSAGVVRYQPLAVACAGCHADAHFAQLGAECARCHTSEAFTPSTFRHDDARFTTFSLDGRHASVKCAGCHPVIEVAPGRKVTRYKPLRRECEDCHTDAHKGAFRGFVP